VTRPEIAALTLLVWACAACGGAAKAKLEKVPGEPGGLVAVNGHKLYVDCEGNGTPTVLLEAGLGGDHTSWDFVQPKLVKTTRVCMYDRAGLGLSPSDPKPRTAQEAVDDLHKLLDKAGIDPPYVLVGHSYGGMLVHLYASEHPHDVTGVVLLDSSNPDQVPRFLAALPKPRPGEYRIVTELRAALGHTPPNSEGVDWTASAAQVRKAAALGAVPLVVVTAGEEDSPALPHDLKLLLDRTWLSLQDDLARLSTDNVHVIATTSPHDVMSPLGQPALVIEAIREDVRATRSGARLTPCGRALEHLGGKCVP
jgi:pimeloyl-ACP methyl ester carboxylesterase